MQSLPQACHDSRRFAGRIHFALIIALIFIIGCSFSKDRSSLPVANNGVIDLRSWDFSKRGPVPLSGTWEFYWNRILDPADFQNNRENAIMTGFAEVPGIWNGTTLGTAKIVPHGYATYRLKILTPPAAPRLGIRLFTFSTAFRLFANGVEIASAGTVGRNHAESIPAYFPQVADIPDNRGEIELVLHVSNFHYRVGGPWRHILIGPEKGLHHNKLIRSLGSIFLFGSLVIMGFYHLVLYLFRREDIHFLHFSLFNFIIAGRSLSTGEYLLAQILPSINFNTLIRIEYLSSYLAIPAISWFFHSIYPNRYSRMVTIAISIILGLFSMFVILTPTTLFTRSVFAYYFISYLCIVYLTIILIFAVKHKKQGAIVILGGGIVLGLAAVNDGLHSSFIIRTGNIIDIALLFFILGQSIVLSKKLTAAFNSVQTLSEELTDLNMNLESQVADRTRQLQQAYETIKDISIKDNLTGCFNRGFMKEQFPKEIERATRYLRSLSIILCDIDHFKSINDRYGHLAGDRVLVEFAALLQQSIRNRIDWIGRYGGEEFLIVLPETAPDNAVILAERIRAKTADSKILIDGNEISITASFGVTGFHSPVPEIMVTQITIFEKADNLLYQAKNSGRNRIVAAPLEK